MEGQKEYTYKFVGPDPLYCGVCDLIIYFDSYDENALPCCALIGRDIKDQKKRLKNCPLLVEKLEPIDEVE